MGLRRFLLAKCSLLLACVALAACGGGTGPQILFPPDQIELAPTGSGNWSAPPVEADLGTVSNNGGGYTGEIDRYEIVTPAPGRLQVSLTWNHQADFDVIITSDAAGEQVLAEGTEFDFEPEYVGLAVAGGQTLYLFVAGWLGDPGDYTLETVLLPPGAPAFDLGEGFTIDRLTPANGPLVITFNGDLDPAQSLGDRVLVVADGHVAEGDWCVEGPHAVFLPRLPQLPDEDGGLLVGREYIVQFPRGGRGPRAATGEYLSALVAGTIFVDFAADGSPTEPPRVTDVSPGPGEAWDGRTVTVTISEPLHPNTVTPAFFEVVDDENGVLLPFSYRLAQGQNCDDLVVRIEMSLDEPAAPGETVRLVLPATILGISGEDVSQNALAGPAPAPGGGGFAVDFRRP